MKTFAVLCLVLGAASVATQSVNINATWIAGTSTGNSPAALGTVGTPSTAIYPGGRLMPCLAVTQGDTNYKLYIYGGQGYISATLVYLKDFWRYDLASAAWTMLAENPTTAAVTGTRGVEGSNVFPYLLARTSCLISPRDNKLYMFGGVVGSRYNDMWRYNPTSGYWAWLGGGTSTTTPTLNVESSTIFPAVRRNTALMAYPGQDFLVVYGGFSTLDLGDLWKFNTLTNSWTWFGGVYNPSTAASIVYDTLGSTSAANSPGGRNMHAFYMDPATAKFYIFGGFLNTGQPYFNDFWSYNFGVNQWMWISGGTGTNLPPVNGQSGEFSSTFTPGSRSASILQPISGTNYFVLYGGRGYGIAAPTLVAYLNEMWIFDKAVMQWAWITGQQEANTYGTRGTTSSGPYPQARNLFSAVPLAYQQSIIYFAGYNGASYFNDMWKLDISLTSASSSSAAAATSTAAVAASSSVLVSSSADVSSTAPAAAVTSATDSTVLFTSATSIASSGATSVSDATVTATTSAMVVSTSAASTDSVSASSVSTDGVSSGSSANSATISSSAIASSAAPTTSATIVSTSSSSASSSAASVLASSTTQTAAATSTTNLPASSSAVTSTRASSTPVTSSVAAASSTVAVTSTRASSSLVASTSSSASSTRTSLTVISVGTVTVLSSNSIASSSASISTSEERSSSQSADSSIVTDTANAQPSSSLTSSSDEEVVTTSSTDYTDTATTVDATTTGAPDGSNQAALADTTDIGALLVQPEIIAGLIAVIIIVVVVMIKLCLRQKKAQREADKLYTANPMRSQMFNVETGGGMGVQGGPVAAYEQVLTETSLQPATETEQFQSEVGTDVRFQV